MANPGTGADILKASVAIAVNPSRAGKSNPPAKGSPEESCQQQQQRHSSAHAVARTNLLHWRTYLWRADVTVQKICKCPLDIV